jgi:hypothetical protein
MDGDSQALWNELCTQEAEYLQFRDNGWTILGICLDEGTITVNPCLRRFTRGSSALQPLSDFSKTVASLRQAGWAVEKRRITVGFVFITSTRTVMRELEGHQHRDFEGPSVPSGSVVRVGKTKIRWDHRFGYG